jgi:hypothetical protein
VFEPVSLGISLPFRFYLAANCEADFVAAKEALKGWAGKSRIARLIGGTTKRFFTVH